jgi:hypothetical protein
VIRIRGIAGPYSRVEFQLEDGEYVVGRGRDAQIDLSADPGVSRRHLRLLVQGDTVHFTDLHSLHGTFVNGQRVANGTLDVGDQLQVGASILLRGLPLQPQPQPYETLPGQAPQTQQVPPQTPRPPPWQAGYQPTPTGLAYHAAVGAPLAPGWETAGLVLGIMGAAASIFSGWGFIFTVGVVIGAVLVRSDMRGRGLAVLAGLSPLGWVALVLMLWPLGVITYLVYRPDGLSPI